MGMVANDEDGGNDLSMMYRHRDNDIKNYKNEELRSKAIIINRNLKQFKQNKPKKN